MNDEAYDAYNAARTEAEDAYEAATGERLNDDAARTRHPGYVAASAVYDAARAAAYRAYSIAGSSQGKQS